MQANEFRYDVIIYEIESGKVDTLVGVDLKYSTGFYNAVTRQETVNGRINEHYATAIVPTGLFTKGNIYKS